MRPVINKNRRPEFGRLSSFAPGPRLRDLAELALVALAFLLYFVVRANVIDRPDEALANAQSLIDIEISLGIFVEAAWQSTALESSLLVRLANFVYFWLDFPLVIVIGLLFFLRKRCHYSFTRDALLASGALALVAYNFFPVAPPRLVPEAGVIDTLQVFNNLSYQAQSTEFFVNPYAALPSLHVGWAVLLAIGLVRAYPGSRLVLGLALMHPVSQTMATVVTGNHYFIDAAAGLAAAAFGLAVALLLQKFGYTWPLSFVNKIWRIKDSGQVRR